MLFLLTCLTVFTPLVTGLTTILFARRIGPVGAHRLTILGMLIAFCSAASIAGHIETQKSYIYQIFQWYDEGMIDFHIGFLIDTLSSSMFLLVTFISLVVHIYAIGYMHGDRGYQRFFAYMSLFTFAMLMLVSADNLLQLFFGWEGVGVISYLLIGFWFHKDAAAAGSLKAFLVNRVGDFGFILGIALVFSHISSLDYADLFANIALLNIHISWLPTGWKILDMVGLLFFIGAMAKSAQIPLHVWLPESMEGPTPISALIHAATMVTAGIFMIARFSPLYELSPMMLNVILCIGASTAVFLGLVAFVQHDIKRVIAYSTLSQLGYMVAGTGASAYGISMFHLMTHACFKALLFLGAGAVIVAMHHQQDMRKMGGLKTEIPGVALTFLIGTLSLSAVPPFSGFYSKDAIITAVAHSSLPGSNYAYACLVLGAFITAVYSFRAYFLTFCGKRSSAMKLHHINWTISLPLIILSIPSVFLGAFMAPFVVSKHGIFSTTAQIAPHTLSAISTHFAHPGMLMFTAWMHPAFWMTIAGIICAYVAYISHPKLPHLFAKRAKRLYVLLLNQLGFDACYERYITQPLLTLSASLSDRLEVNGIDRYAVNGSAQLIVWLSKCFRKLQTGFLFHYTAIMIFALFAAIFWFISKPVVAFYIRTIQ